MDIPPEVIKHAPGVLGAIGSTVFLKGFPWIQRLILVIPASALAHYGSQYLSHLTDLPEGLAGFFLGLFGIALAAKLFDTLNELTLGSVIQKKITQWLGVKE